MERKPSAAEREERLKRDLFGEVWAIQRDQRRYIERRIDRARRCARGPARWLAAREAKALRQLAGIHGVPSLVGFSNDRLRREWLDGQPMHVARPGDPGYFREALALVRRLHCRGVAHNDLAKEPNWLVTARGQPALIDFQLASVSLNRGRLFRVLAREDLRHLLKHKRTYCAEHLTARQRRMLATPAVFSRIWMASGKRLYLFVTRRLLRWADREGAADRTGL